MSGSAERLDPSDSEHARVARRVAWFVVGLTAFGLTVMTLVSLQSSGTSEPILTQGELSDLVLGGWLFAPIIVGLLFYSRLSAVCILLMRAGDFLMLVPGLEQLGVSNTSFNIGSIIGASVVVVLMVFYIVKVTAYRREAKAQGKRIAGQAWYRVLLWPYTLAWGALMAFGLWMLIGNPHYGELRDASKMTDHERVWIAENDILADGEELVFFYTALEIETDGNLLADEHVASWFEDQGEFYYDRVALSDISSVEVTMRGDFFNDTLVVIDGVNGEWVELYLPSYDRGDERFLERLEEMTGVAAEWPQDAPPAPQEGDGGRFL